MTKITLDKFIQFIEEHRILQGFNMTNSLMQQLFSELDPHKKSYLTEHDWALAFSDFHWEDYLLQELKDSIGCFFSDVESAFEFFVSYRRNSSSISSTRPTNALVEMLYEEDFTAGVRSLTGSRYTDEELTGLWKILGKCKPGGQRGIAFSDFRKVFEGELKTSFIGKKTTQPIHKLASTTGGARASSLSKTANSSFKAEAGLVERFKNLLKTGNRDLR